MRTIVEPSIMYKSVFFQCVQSRKKKDCAFSINQNCVWLVDWIFANTMHSVFQFCIDVYCCLQWPNQWHHKTAIISRTQGKVTDVFVLSRQSCATVKVKGVQLKKKKVWKNT